MSRPASLVSLFIALFAVTCDEWPPDEASAAPPSLPWQVHWQGTGRIQDFGRGTDVDIPFDDRVHVAILPEGFTADDIAQGRFDREVGRWMEEVFSIEPFASFRDALVIWKRPVASRQPLGRGGLQPNDTALRLPITGDGTSVGSVASGGLVARRVWSLLRGLPVSLTSYGPGGRSHRLVRNLVVVVLPLDPASGRAGFSGRTVRLADPTNADRLVATAIAFGRAHEFGHALALLEDEYLDVARAGGVDNARAHISAFVSNVVARPHCGELPWAHLLPGGAHAPAVEGLVGAFGVPGNGFHSELKCLMNGTHDNARYYGGNGNLRTRERLCNFCRELATFRLFERAGVLADPRTSWQAWVDVYRAPFYSRFPFFVPAAVPQTNNAGQPHFQSCVENRLADGPGAVTSPP